MHVTIIGAGTLGRVYGLRLLAAGDEVAFVVRPARAEETSSFILEQVNGEHRRDVIEQPRRVTAVPAATRVVLLAVRFDQIASEEVASLLRAAPSVPIVVLTPLMPRQQAALEAASGRRVTAAMPSVSGYFDERGVVRHWIIKLASTLIDETGLGDASRPPLEELARHLTREGIATHLEAHVGSLNVATTATFFPLIASINAGGGVDGVLADKDLLATTIDAAHETAALGSKLGKVAPWANVLTKFVGPYTIKPGVALARLLAPEAVRFAEQHFGPKLHAQHLAMGAAILELGRDHDQAMPALEHLMDRVRSSGDAA
jgi:predicted dinucleotide-binding enzyme